VTVPVAADLAAVPVGRRTVRVYLRQCFIPPDGNADPLWVNPAVPSRWWTPEGTLYVAEEQETVLAEHCRNNAGDVQTADPTGGVGLNTANLTAYVAQPVGVPLLARAMFSVEVTFDRMADLRSAGALGALAAMDINEDDLLADDYGPCPALAQAGQALGWQAIRSRSAAWADGSCVAVFDGAFPPAAAWRLEEATVRPSVRIALLTRYRDGERAGWLLR
jgi:hypothetical protein